MDDELPEQKIDFSRFKDIFKSMENQLILQTSILKSIYGLNNESSRDNTRRTQYNKIAEVEAASGGPDANGYTYNSFRQPQAQSDYAKNTEETSSANSPINLLGAAALGGAGFSGAMGLIKATFTKIIKGQGFIGTMAKIFKSAIVLAFAGAVGDFVGGASEQTATNFGADPETSKAIGGITENATEWGTWGYVLGSFVKKRVLFSLVGAVAGGVRNAFDPDKNGKIDDGVLKGFNIDALTGISGGLSLIISSFLGKWLWSGMKKVMSKVHMPAILTKLTGMFRGIDIAADVGIAANAGSKAVGVSRIEPPVTKALPKIPTGAPSSPIINPVLEGKTLPIPGVAKTSTPVATSAFRAFGGKALGFSTKVLGAATRIISGPIGTAYTAAQIEMVLHDHIDKLAKRDAILAAILKNYQATNDADSLLKQLLAPNKTLDGRSLAAELGLDYLATIPDASKELEKILRDIGSGKSSIRVPTPDLPVINGSQFPAPDVTTPKFNGFNTNPASKELSFQRSKIMDYIDKIAENNLPQPSPATVNVSPVTVGGATTSSVTNNNTTIITNPYASLNSPFLPQ